MAFCRLVFPLLVLSVASCYGSVPAYIWGDIVKSSEKANPMNPVSVKDFKLVLKHNLLDQPLTVVFIDETLSVEDLSTKNEDGETAFDYLEDNHGDAVYLPSVESPVTALRRFAEDAPLYEVTVTENGLDGEITTDAIGDSKFLIINFEDASEIESRFDVLSRHDKFMENVMSELKNNGKVAAIYTARKPSWTIPETHSRVRRAVRSTDYKLDGLRMYANSIILSSGNDSQVLDGHTASSTQFNETVMDTTITFGDTSITLKFSMKGGYWFFDNVNLSVPSLTEELQPLDEVYAILGFSYRCLQNVSFASVNETKSYTLTFEDLKIQPFFTTTNSTVPPEFGDAFHCVGFFSAPIWSGLFVVFILLAITFYGIMMMMDIRTMDRFDDPKGKTITINAAE